MAMSEEATEVTQDPEDVLSDALQTLYDYAPITHSSAGSVFRYTIRAQPPSDGSTGGSGPKVVTLETPDTQADNWALHASSIWTSAVFIAEHTELLRLEQHVARARAAGELPLRILELGAGAGLPSVVLAATRADVHVTASDYPDAGVVRALTANIARNGVAERCAAVPYAWGADPAPLLVPTVREGGDMGFDVVFAADTLWNPELHALFAETLRSALRRSPHARVYLVAGMHTGRYTLQAFMRMLGDYGFSLEKATEWEANGGRSREWDVGRAEGEDEAERRKWVVYMSIKWRDI